MRRALATQSILGLRVDVDTFRGTRLGVPRLLEILARHGVRASLFFSVGPDNMGRHLWRLLRPAFLAKMLRTRAASLYGWDILLRGTLWPGPVIGERLSHVMKAAAAAGHEIGLHAWDHHRWQRRCESLDAAAVRRDLGLAVQTLTRAAGAPPVCTAAPAWRCTDGLLRETARLAGLRYNSDCRGEGVFQPLVDGEPLGPPQVPVSLPTYDEVAGQDGVTLGTYNEFMLGRLRPGGYNTLAVHAEVEGISTADLFDTFLGEVRALGYRPAPLSELLPPAGAPLPAAAIVRREIQGREGWISCRAPAGACGS